MSTNPIHLKYDLISPHLDERTRRLWLGAEALSISRGGVTQVSNITGVSRNTISQGCKEIMEAPLSQITGETKRIRKKGGGRKKVVESDPALASDLESLINPFTRGDPENPLRWTTKSLRQLSKQLKKMDHDISFRSVGTLLHQIGYSLQANRKVHEGTSHTDRNAQFEYINNQCISFIQEKQPVISIDAKKKELIGNVKNGGKEWRPKGQPEEVNVYDFPSQYEKAIPYGIYDVANNAGWVNVGIDHDTASFAVESIRRWWRSMGSDLYPKASKILITADCGGSNGYRVRLWKKELQKLADEEKLTIKVCHLPPGTSKWNKIEHRLFSFISINWRGKPLTSYEVIISLINSTTTESGLFVKSVLDENAYPRGIKISDREMAEINLQKDEFHGDWNYTITPNL